MDLTIPYTFYPLALPHWIAWVLFLLAVLGGLAIGAARGFRAGLLSAVVLLIATMLASMVITFFVHDL